MDCHAIHTAVHAGGIKSLIGIGVTILMATLVGIPIILTAAVSGLLLSPLTGAAIATSSVITSLLLIFMIFRFLGRDHLFVSYLDQFLRRTNWFLKFQDSQAGSGLTWINNQMQTFPYPVIWLAAYCGAVVRHLSAPSFVAGTFAAIFIVIVVYSFAGANIGCAMVDYHFGLSLDRYRIPILLSVAMMLLTARLRPRFTL